MTTADVLAHWGEVAAALPSGRAPMTRDVILKRLEMREIAAHVSCGAVVHRAQPRRLLDAGCGDGETAMFLASGFPGVHVTGFDAVPGMVAAARQRAVEAGAPDGPGGRCTFLPGDVASPPDALRAGGFDLVYTERALINLPDAAAQQRTVAALWRLVAPGGALLCVESCADGLAALNRLRAAADLDAIAAPWHNRYLRAAAVASWLSVAPRVHDFTATYYLLSRVVNAVAAAAEGREPAYDSPINALALLLPTPLVAEGCGQTWSWCWRKP